MMLITVPLFQTRLPNDHAPSSSNQGISGTHRDVAVINPNHRLCIRPQTAGLPPSSTKNYLLFMGMMFHSI